MAALRTAVVFAVLAVGCGEAVIDTADETRGSPEGQRLTGTCGDPAESELFALTNAERAARGLGPVACHSGAAQAARSYAQYLCSAGFFSHFGPDGSSPPSRLAAAGVAFSGYGENLGMGYGTPAEVMQGWMNSPSHRDNVVSGTLTHLGIGHYLCGTGVEYWVQEFVIPTAAAPPPPATCRFAQYPWQSELLLDVWVGPANTSLENALAACPGALAGYVTRNGEWKLWIVGAPRAVNDDVWLGSPEAVFIRTTR